MSADSGPCLRVTFVCTYNRARSVMAEAMFAEQLRRRGLGDVVRVSSCGTNAWLGGGADERVHRTLVSRGYASLGDHRATQVGAEHLAADLVVVMSREQVRILQQLGVGGERIRCLDIENPCTGDDFVHACDRIEAAMPCLHRWVDEVLTGPGFGCLKAAWGWRFWTVERGDVLRSPFVPGITWPTKWVAAACHNLEHAPPVRGCECGWYADLTSADVVARADAYRETARLGLVARQFDAPPLLVVGRLRLVDVCFVRPIVMLPNCAEVEYRAGWGGIAALYVDDAPEAAALAAELCDRYDVPVHTRNGVVQPDEWGAPRLSAGQKA